MNSVPSGRGPADEGSGGQRPTAGSAAIDRPGLGQATEQAGLPEWLYPLGFWVAVVLLAAGVLVPRLAFIGVVWVASVPVLAAVWVALAAWTRDRRLALAALSALAGLAAVFVVRQFI